MLRAGFLALCLVLAGCGFRPLYASLDGDDEIGGALAEVELGDVTGPADAREFLRSTLIRRFPPTAEDPQFAMDVQLREVRRAVSVNIDSTARRFNYTLIASVSYKDGDTGQTRRQSLQSVASFAVTSSQYASLVAREDAVRRAVIDLARKIEIDAALYAAGRAPEASDGNLFSTTSRRDPLRRLEDEARIGEQEAREEAPPAETP